MTLYFQYKWIAVEVLFPCVIEKGNHKMGDDVFQIKSIYGCINGSTFIFTSHDFNDFLDAILIK